MDRSKSIVLAIAFLFLAAGSSLAQSRQSGEPASGDYGALINRVFAPITSKLKLTNEQRTIVAREFRLQNQLEIHLGASSN